VIAVGLSIVTFNPPRRHCSDISNKAPLTGTILASIGQLTGLKSLLVDFEKVAISIPFPHVSKSPAFFTITEFPDHYRQK